jgi:hypothetical protein
MRDVSQCVVRDCSDGLDIYLVARVCFSSSLVLVVLLTDSHRSTLHPSAFAFLYSAENKQTKTKTEKKQICK